MRERLSSIVAIVLLAVLIGASYFYAVQLRLKSFRYVPSESSPDYTAVNASLTVFDAAGAPLRRVSASKMLHFSDERIEAEQIRYASLERDKAQISAFAERGWSNDGGASIHFDNNVEITRSAWENTPIIRFKTSSLVAYPDSERFVSDAPVFLSRGNDTTSASGLDYNHVSGTVMLSGGVKTRIVSRK